MILYHGTSLSTAQMLEASPRLASVEVGGGELGRGFYAADHVALAAAWARGRHPRYGVLSIEIATSEYVQLNILILHWAQVVSTWNQLKAHHSTRTHTFGVDVVHGPLATLRHATQHKFESEQAEGVLRKSVWSKL